MDCSTPGLPSITNSQFAQTHVHCVSDTIQPSHPLSSPSPPAFSLSQHQGLFNKAALHIKWPKYWSFNFSSSPFNEHSELISFMMYWLDLLAVQGTLKSLLQHHSSKASILWHSAFFIVQLSHPYMTTGKTIALTRQTFVCKVMALLFNTLSRLLIAFLPSSKCASISWLQSPSVVILEPKKLRVNLSFFFFLQPEEAHLKHLPRAGNCIQWRHSVPCTAVQGSTRVHALFSTLTL